MFHTDYQFVISAIYSYILEYDVHDNVVEYVVKYGVITALFLLLDFGSYCNCDWASSVSNHGWCKSCSVMTTISDPVRFLLGGWDVTEFLNLLADMVTIISLVILVGLFSMQQFGTARVGFMFAPIFLLWFVSIGLIGIYNIINHDKSIFHAFSPLHIVCFCERNKKAGWEHIGGVVLCITGKQCPNSEIWDMHARLF